MDDSVESSGRMTLESVPVFMVSVPHVSILPLTSLR